MTGWTVLLCNHVWMQITAPTRKAVLKHIPRAHLLNQRSGDVIAKLKEIGDESAAMALLNESERLANEWSRSRNYQEFR